MGVFDFKNKNSHPNKVYTPSLNLIALKCSHNYPPKYSPLAPEIPPGGFLGGKVARWVSATFLTQNRVYIPSLSLIALKINVATTTPKI